MLKLYGRRNAYNVQKVLWAVAELALPYEHIDVGSTAGQLDTPDFLDLNPHARIPVLVDGETTVWESNSIVRHLKHFIASSCAIVYIKAHNSKLSKR